ncbi:endonuclease/exonuclease/phosphatase family protein [Aestuariibaculum sediminum]|uniref:Endonuclease/exonuclease/phosphatase family protein n=1 Tax=Aestuariibaculum sediminum TaxID=2770637 RepID=A0A8J6QAI4_9FLAO|nr:endonuclease/exonuclease/phosphatase family protein [Aestuariibaculum sediminum]MBD0831981.1 endonuclease/exonuclease/phosphatase family protein [Aestuariibaculum sediminum]
MKHYLINILLVFVINFGCLAQASQSNLKIMTYNIWNGFDWGKDQNRHDNFIKFIKDTNPDVLALQELCGYNEEKLKSDAAQWGHNYVKILKTEGYPVGLTSKRPIKVKALSIEGYWHGMLHCETFGIDFFVVHLSPADCNFRLKEANQIVKSIEMNSIEKYVVLGDFNAHSPMDFQKLNKQTELLKRYSKENNKRYSNLRLGQFDFSVVSKFLAMPLIDICASFVDEKERFTFPTPILIGKYRTDMNDVIKSRERIDYILVSPRLSRFCINSTILNHGVPDQLSDHYPIVAEFEFN